METILKDYFKWVFTEDFFTIALDVTGAYLFSDCADDEEIGEQFNQFKDALQLSDEECVLCVIGRKSKWNYCGVDYLSRWVMKASRAREAVFTQDDVKSILDCYEYDYTNPGILHVELAAEEPEEFSIEIAKPRTAMIPVLCAAIFFVLLAVILLYAKQCFFATVLVIFPMTMADRVYAKTESLLALTVRRITMFLFIFCAMISLLELTHDSSVSSMIQKFFGKRK